MPENRELQTFWDHLDVLRGVLFRILGVALTCGVAAFLFKDELFDIVLAPRDSGFVTYRFIDSLLARAGMSSTGNFSVELINTGLARQFMIHLKTAFCAGILFASPYVVFELFRFISPALYSNERRSCLITVVGGYIMFVAGLLFSYLVVFPITFRFLGTYQVEADVTNMIDLESYMSVFIMLGLWMGVVFEMPVIAWLLARFGMINAGYMRRYRRHSIVVILTLAAIITPTSDVFTLMLVSLPMWILYEASIAIVASVRRQRDANPALT